MQLSTSETLKTSEVQGKGKSQVLTRASPNRLLTNNTSILNPLEIIFNKSLWSGDIPDEWRTTTVMPLFKKSTKGNPGNYKPVSLTSMHCKILESLIKDGLMSHLFGKNLIKESQHGFLPGKLCTSNLVEFIERVTKLVDKGTADGQSPTQKVDLEIEGQRSGTNNC